MNTGGRRPDAWSGNHLTGPCLVFSHGSREPFMGVYHPHTRAGVVHYSSIAGLADQEDLVVGRDADGLDWRKALSDDESAYVEVQAGLFRNQETYAFLEPQEQIRFTEYWMPVRDDRRDHARTRTRDRCISRATASSAGSRRPGRAQREREIGARRRRCVVKDGPAVRAHGAAHLTAAEAAQRTFAGLPAAPRYTVEVRDGAGRVLLTHTEDQLRHVARVGDPPRAPARARDAAARPAQRRATCSKPARDQSSTASAWLAWDTLRGGTQAFPGEPGPAQGRRGRLAVDLCALSPRRPRCWNRLARGDTTDPEVQYYLGLAHEGLGQDGKARAEFEAAHHFRDFRAPAPAEAWPRPTREPGDFAAGARPAE